MPTTYTVKWQDLLRVIAVPLVILIGVIIAFALFKGPSSDLNTFSLSNAGYNYTFDFYRAATKVQLSDESNAYRYADQAIAVVKPVNDLHFTKCTQNGGKWHEVFKVQLGSMQYPVCTPNDAGFTFYFQAQGIHHLFTVTYNSTQTSKAYPDLKDVFGSVKVSK